MARLTKEEYKDKMAQGREKAKAQRAAEQAELAELRERVKAMPAAAPGFELPAAYSKATSDYKLGPVIQMGEDEWDKKIKSTYNPFDEAAEPYKKANPDRHFAFQSPRIQRLKGNREMEPVIGPDGHQVIVAGQILYHEPLRQRDAKNKLILKRAADQAAAPEESYREIQERIAHSRRDVGVNILKENDIVRGSGAAYNRDGDIVGAEGAAQIGIRTTTGTGQ